MLLVCALAVHWQCILLHPFELAVHGSASFEFFYMHSPDPSKIADSVVLVKNMQAFTLDIVEKEQARLS